MIFGVKPETKDGEACMKVRVRGEGNVLRVLRGAACLRARAGKTKAVYPGLVWTVRADDVALNNGRARLGVQAIEQVIYDFLAHITSRPDRKINKVLCMWPCVFQSAQDARACLERRSLTRISLSRQGLLTSVEAELEQAKLTISNLKDTHMRQETILRQYAEEVCIRRYRVLFLGWLPDASRLHSSRVNAGRARAVFLKNSPISCASPLIHTFGDAHCRDDSPNTKRMLCHVEMQIWACSAHSF